MNTITGIVVAALGMAALYPGSAAADVSQPIARGQFVRPVLTQETPRVLPGFREKPAIFCAVRPSAQKKSMCGSKHRALQPLQHFI